MKCWKCGNDIPDGSEYCTYCSTSQKRQPTQTEEGKALRTIYDKFGCNAVFSNAKYITNALGDLLDKADKLKKQIELAYETGIGQLYLNQLKNKGFRDAIFTNKIINILSEDAGFGKSVTSKIVDFFDEMIGWEIKTDQTSYKGKENNTNTESANTYNRDKSNNRNDNISQTKTNAIRTEYSSKISHAGAIRTKKSNNKVVHYLDKLSNENKNAPYGSKENPIIVRKSILEASKGFGGSVNIGGKEVEYEFDPYPDIGEVFVLNNHDKGYYFKFELNDKAGCISAFVIWLLAIILFIYFQKSQGDSVEEIIFYTVMCSILPGFIIEIFRGMINDTRYKNKRRLHKIK